MAKKQTDNYPDKTDPRLVSAIEACRKAVPGARFLGVASQMAKNSVPQPTGSYTLDYCIGIGGLLPGKISEFYGPPKSGKSLLIYQIIRQYQQAGKFVAYGDIEDSMGDVITQDWMIQQGVDPTKLLYFRDTAENAFNIATNIATNPDFGYVVIDSIGALATERLTEDGEVGDMAPDGIPKLLKQFTGKFLVVNQGAHLTCINQARADFNARRQIGHEAITTSGGYAWRHNCHLRVEVRGTPMWDVVNGEKIPVGMESKIKVIKNKWASDGKTGIVRYYWGEGIDNVDELANLALKHSEANGGRGIIQRAGGWCSFSHDGKELKQNGIDNFVLKLREHPGLQQELWRQIKASRTNSVDIPVEELDRD